ncbi:MAG: SPOR domain-containing protein [Gammaproteobacteria bacterium]
MNKKLYNLVFVILLIAVISACTTTTKTLSREVSVSSKAEVHNAKVAFSQKNYAVAAELLKPLASQGRDDAQYALGYLYFNGMGVPRNKSRAVQLFNSAAASGNENAKKALANMPASESHVIDLRDKKDSLPEPMPMSMSSSEAGSGDDPAVMDSPALRPNIDQPPQAEQMAKEEPTDMDMLSDAENLTEGEKWISGQPKNNFTIQLIVLADESTLQRFISENNLQKNSVYYPMQKSGKTYYALVHGTFGSYSLAEDSAATLSSKLNIEDPWIRKISDIQKLISEH